MYTYKNTLVRIRTNAQGAIAYISYTQICNIDDLIKQI